MKATRKSKTMWVNYLALALGIITFTCKQFGVEPQEPPTWLVSLIMVLVPIINLILRRYFTKEAIGGKIK